MVTARVILKQCKSYRDAVDGRWIQDVPRIIKGKESVQKYINNGFFTVVVLKGAEELKSEAVKKTLAKAPTKAPVEDSDEDDDEDEAPVSSKKPAKMVAKGVALKPKKR